MHSAAPGIRLLPEIDSAVEVEQPATIRSESHRGRTTRPLRPASLSSGATAAWARSTEERGDRGLGQVEEGRAGDAELHHAPEGHRQGQRAGATGHSTAGAPSGSRMYM